MFWEIFVRLCQIGGVSPNAVAKKAGVKSSGTVSAWKKGTMPRDGVLKAIADYFGVDTDFLLGLSAEGYAFATESHLIQLRAEYENETDPAKRQELAIAIDGFEESLEDQRIGIHLSAIKKNTAAHVGDGGSSKVMEFLESQPKDVLRGILAALQAPEDVLAELDRPERKE